MRTSKTPAEFQLYAETSSEKVTDANGNVGRSKADGVEVTGNNCTPVFICRLLGSPL